MSDSLWSHGLQHTRLLCPPLSRCTYTTNLKILYYFSGFDDVWNCLAFKTFNLLSLLPFLSSVQLLSHVRLSATPWTAAYQASLSITNSQSLLRLMSIESVMPSNRLFLCRPLLLPPSIFPSIMVFSNVPVLRIRWPKYWVSASASALPINIQDWFPLGWTDWISLQSKGISRVFSNTTVQKHQFFGAQPSLWPNSHLYVTTGKNHSFD